MSFDASKYVKSRWLKGTDLPAGQQTTVTIKAAYEHTFDQSNETKPALDFYDLDQSLVLNKTQTATMIDLFSNNPDAWRDKRIRLAPVPSGFQGKPTILITAAPEVNGAAVPASEAIPEVQFQ